MEKTASTTTIIKGSTSAAADVIMADIDPEALCCPKCLHPLVPPVLQCAAGHLICSSCHNSLEDKNKCVSCVVKCFIPTSYSRNHAVEGILGAVRVTCPNTIYGCTAGKMLYHEKMEHEKVCPSKPGPGGTAGRVVKMGPCGGDGGQTMDMDAYVSSVSRIVKVAVWHRAHTVDAMSITYERDGREEKTDTWGGPVSSSAHSEICLSSDEYLTGVKGHSKEYVTSLTLISNRRTFGPYGAEEGGPFELPAAGGVIVGFYGRSGGFINAIGTYVKMDV